MGLVRGHRVANPPTLLAAEPEPFAQLSHDRADERRKAARRLQGFGMAAATALAARLALEGDPSVREAVVDSLLTLGCSEDPSVAEAIGGAAAHLLPNPAAPVRNAAVAVLQGLGERAQGILSTLLTDRNADIRILALNALTGSADAWARDLVADHLQDETDARVCGTAIDILADIGDEGSLPAIDAVRVRFADDPYLAFTIDLIRTRRRAVES